MATKTSFLFELGICKLQIPLLFFFLFLFSAISCAQVEESVSDKKKHRLIHSFGFSLNNGIYLPEKVYDKIGIVEQAPRVKYGYEFNLNYNLIFFRGLGATTEFAFGMIPDGVNITSNGKIPNDTTWFNGNIGDPTQTSFVNGLGLYYWGFNVKLNYLIPITKRLVVQPEIGMKTVQYFSYYHEDTKTLCDNNLINCVDYFYQYSDNNSNANNASPYRVKRNFFPDLLAGVNFFVYPKNPKHCIKIGLSFNYGFVPRLEGYYIADNIGNKYKSSGKVQYGSTHFGISLGYQFLGIKKNYWASKSSRNNMLFNPRY